MNLLRTSLFAAAIAIAVLGTAGCASRSSGPDGARSEKKALESAKLPVNLLDKSLRSKLGSELQESERLADGRLSIAVNLRNRTHKNLQIQARTVFKNAGGISVGDESAWRDIFLSPQQAETYRRESLTTEAELYTVEVRIPRKPGK